MKNYLQMPVVSNHLDCFLVELETFFSSTTVLMTLNRKYESRSLEVLACNFFRETFAAVWKVDAAYYEVFFSSSSQSETFLVKSSGKLKVIQRHCSKCTSSRFFFAFHNRGQCCVLHERRNYIRLAYFWLCSSSRWSCSGAKQALEAVTHLSFRTAGQLWCYSRLNTQ